MVKFRGNWRIFGACNDRLKKGLGAEQRFKGLITFETAGA